MVVLSGLKNQHIETQQSELEEETCCFLQQDLEVSEERVIFAKLVVFLVDMFRIQHESLQQER